MAADEFLLVVLVFGIVAWLAWLVAHRQKTVAQARLKRADVFNRLLEKIGTAKELSDFLNTEQGKNLIGDPLPEQMNPRKTALRFVQLGIALGAFSIALILSWLRVSSIVHADPNPDINWISKELDYYYWSVLAVSLSGGMFVIAFVTNWLVRRWHLNGNSGHN